MTDAFEELGIDQVSGQASFSMPGIDALYQPCKKLVVSSETVGITTHTSNCILQSIMSQDRHVDQISAEHSMRMKLNCLQSYL